MVTNKSELASALLAKGESRLMCGLILEETGVMRSTMRADALQTAYAEGMRDAGLLVFSLLWGLDETAPIRCMSEYGNWVRDHSAEWDKARERENGGNE